MYCTQLKYKIGQLDALSCCVVSDFLNFLLPTTSRRHKHLLSEEPGWVLRLLRTYESPRSFHPQEGTLSKIQHWRAPWDLKIAHDALLAGLLERDM